MKKFTKDARKTLETLFPEKIIEMQDVEEIDIHSTISNHLNTMLRKLYQEIVKIFDVLDEKANPIENQVRQAVSQAIPEPNVLGEHFCDDCRYWKYCKREIRYWDEKGHRIDAKLEYCSKWKTKLASQL